MFGSEIPTRTVDRSLVGVVSVTGMVIEHDEGYRSQGATAIAVVARYGAMRLITDDARTIEYLFDDPFGTLTRSVRDEHWSSNEAREFLESVQSEDEKDIGNELRVIDVDEAGLEPVGIAPIEIEKPVDSSPKDI